MGGERSADRFRHPLPAMQVAPDRIPPADAQVHHSLAGQRSFYGANFPEGILLPGLPLHLGEGRRSAAATRHLGNVFLTRATRGEAPNPKHQAPGKHQIPSSKQPFSVCFFFWCLGFLWSLELGAWCLELRRSTLLKNHAPKDVTRSIL